MILMIRRRCLRHFECDAQVDLSKPRDVWTDASSIIHIIPLRFPWKLLETIGNNWKLPGNRFFHQRFCWFSGIKLPYPVWFVFLNVCRSWRIPEVLDPQGHGYIDSNLMHEWLSTKGGKVAMGWELFVVDFGRRSAFLGRLQRQQLTTALKTILPSGNLLHSYGSYGKMAIEIVSFPMKNGDFSIAMWNYQRVDSFRLVFSFGSVKFAVRPVTSSRKEKPLISWSDLRSHSWL